MPKTKSSNPLSNSSVAAAQATAVKRKKRNGSSKSKEFEPNKRGKVEARPAPTAAEAAMEAFTLESQPQFPIPIFPINSAANEFYPYIENGIRYIPQLPVDGAISTAAVAFLPPPLPPLAPLPVPYANYILSNSSAAAATHNLYIANGTIYTPSLPVAAASAEGEVGVSLPVEDGIGRTLLSDDSYEGALLATLLQTPILTPIPLLPTVDQSDSLSSEFVLDSSANTGLALKTIEYPFSLTEEEQAASNLLAASAAAAVLDAPIGNRSTSTSSVGTSPDDAVHGNGDLTLISPLDQLNDNSVTIAELQASVDLSIPSSFVPGIPASPHVRHSIFSPLTPSPFSPNFEPLIASLSTDSVLSPHN